MIESLVEEIRSCRLCEAELPLGPRPVLQVSSKAKILIAAQAPGTRVHTTGVPFNDPSGDRLREWLGVEREQFYNEELFSIVPMGFCYPGKGKSGDLPPRKECAQTWHGELMVSLKNIQLSLVIGQYAFKYHMPQRSGNLTDNIKAWEKDWPNQIVLPHPSPRNNIWLKRNPWFEQEVVPRIKRRVSEVIAHSY